jgi:hypothetical protein
MPVINKPIEYFSVATWNGSGSATATIEFGMQPDLVVIKPRNNVAANANAWVVVDSTRGTSARLSFNSTAPEWTESNNVISFNSTGITVGDSHNVNKNTTSQYVGYGWKKGATQGFDIVAITAQASGSASFAHSLGVAPKMFIIKPRTGSYGWAVYHASLGNTQYLTLNSTNAAATNSALWNNTSPTSTEFTLGSGHAGTGTQIVYLFSEVAGFSRFGSYTGNGSADGPFVFCGFLPRFVLLKATDATNANDWCLIDTARKTFNPDGVGMRPNLLAAEFDDSTTPSNGIIIDALSNGFKLRGTSTRTNGSGGTYIFMAFAENPFKNALAR